MAKVTRRLKILEHLLKAQEFSSKAAEHHTAAMQLLMDDEKADSDRPKEHSVRPPLPTTRLALPAFDKNVALAELRNAYDASKTTGDYGRVRDMAKRLVMSSVLEDADIQPFLTKPGEKK